MSSCKKEEPITLNDNLTDKLEVRNENIYAINANKTLLGNQRNNPYEIHYLNAANQALGATVANALTATHTYIRFRPQTPEQIVELGQLEFPVFDFPTDRKIMCIGDKYDNPDVPAGRLPYYYATVPDDAAVPTSIPQDHLYRVRYNVSITILAKSYELAGYNAGSDEMNEFNERLLNGTEDGSFTGEDMAIKIPIDGDPGGDGGGPTTSGSTYSDVIPTNLVKRTDCSCEVGTNKRNFTGCIRVWDSQINDWVAARHIRTIALGPFGMWVSAETNDGGCFRNGVDLYGAWFAFVEMVNECATINNHQKWWDAALGESLLPHKYCYRDFQGRFAKNCGHDFEWEQDDTQKRNAIWRSITINNAVYEMHDFAKAIGITTPPAKLKILSNISSGDGAAPLLNKIQTLIPSYMWSLDIRNILSESGNGFTSEAAVASLASFAQLILPDVLIGRQTDPNRAINPMRSDIIKELVYHELAHTIHWRNVSNQYWWDEIDFSIEHRGYGDGTDPGSGRPAIVESWANFIGAIFADASYRDISGPYIIQNAQQLQEQTDDETSFLQALERFNPNQAGDEFNWIPKGIMHDLRDNTNVAEQFIPIANDNVSGYTIRQMFNALNNDITTPQLYRARLLQQNNNNQQAEVNTLFTTYGY